VSSNVAEFTLDLRRLASEAPAKALGQFVRGVALEAGKRIIQRTPVDTGRARGSWQTTMGAPAQTDNGRVDGSGAAARAELFAVSSQLRATPFTPIYISSNLPYIRVLEFGLYSTPGPHGKPIRVPKRSKSGRRLSDAQRAKRYQAALLSKTTPEGFSRQAPRGMVGITFEEMRQLVASATFRKSTLQAPAAAAAPGGVA
jgi:hypothetical protein